MRLVILTPSRGSLSLGHHAMRLRLALLLKERGHHLSVSEDTTPGLLHHSRNTLLATLASLAPTSTPAAEVRGLWLDADVHFDPHAVVRAMDRPEEVITWAYPVRVTFDPDYPPEDRQHEAAAFRRQPFRLWTCGVTLDAHGLARRSLDRSLVELNHSGFGAVLMKASCAAWMHNTCGPHQRDWSGTALSHAFDHLPGPTRSSEDVSFWRRYMAAGGRIWCDPSPYVTNGTTGGRFADEITLREAQMTMCCNVDAIHMDM
jgi:hypothetical protein